MAPDLARRRVLVLGPGGQVGFELRRAMRAIGEVIPVGRDQADLTAPDSLRAAIHDLRPDVIVNAAAHTAVDRAESEPELAHQVNAVAPAVLAGAAEATGAMLVHYSTDYVFDGRQAPPYRETDPPNPLSVYGRTKLAGELGAATCRRHLVFRTTWVVGLYGANFLKTMLRLAAERDELRIVGDQHGAPTTAALIADVTATAVAAQLERPDDRRWGLYHLAAGGETTWYAYARRVIERARTLGMPIRVPPDGVRAITTAEYPTAAPRPANSRFDTTKLCDAFGVSLPEWGPAVDTIVDQLNLTRPQ